MRWVFIRSCRTWSSFDINIKGVNDKTAHQGWTLALINIINAVNGCSICALKCFHILFVKELLAHQYWQMDVNNSPLARNINWQKLNSEFNSDFEFIYNQTSTPLYNCQYASVSPAVSAMFPSSQSEAAHQWVTRWSLIDLTESSETWWRVLFKCNLNKI